MAYNIEKNENESVESINYATLNVSASGTTTVDTRLYAVVRVTYTGGSTVTLNLTNSKRGTTIYIKDSGGNASANNIVITDTVTHPAATFEVPILGTATTSATYKTNFFSATYLFDGTNYILLNSSNAQLLVYGDGNVLGSGPNAGLTLVSLTNSTPSPAVGMRTTSSTNSPGDTTARFQVYPVGGTYGYVRLSTRDGALGSQSKFVALDTTDGYWHVQGGLAISTFNANGEPTVLGTLRYSSGFILSSSLSLAVPLAVDSGGTSMSSGTFAFITMRG